MNSKQQVKGPIHLYIRWPMVAGVFLAAITVWLFTSHIESRWAMLGLTIAYTALAIYLYIVQKKAVYHELVAYAEEYASAQNRLFRNMSVPYALLLPNGKIIWMNNAFQEATGFEVKNNVTVFQLFPDLTAGQFPSEKESKKEFHMPYRGRKYRLELSCAKNSEPLNGHVQALKTDNFYALYLYDETELARYIRENEEERLITGLVYIDNFDELMDNVDEVRQSMLIALIDQKVGQFLSSIDGIAKKVENDKYFIIFKQKYYERVSAEHFSVLEDVKGIHVGNSVTPTLSIGIGMHCSTLSQCYEYARAAIDMALGRGGDQAVVKEKDHITYFGGKTQQSGRSTRVKARVKAEALREFIMGKEQVIVMGHRMADIDCFGAAMGIYRIAKTLGRRCHIVMDEVTTSVQPFVDTVRNDEEYEKDLFVSNQEAQKLLDRNTMLIVVDTNRPSYTQCPELLDSARTVVVLDHHRMGEEAISNAVLSYVEPYASSASEMVAEIMQYVDDSIRIRSAEADCLFAGMMIDTNNFMTKAGVRTFEAAAYLRRNGADVTRIRKNFRDDIDSYRAKAETIRHAEVYHEYYAIACFPHSEVPSPTIIGAQAANEMLNIRGIRASFVLTPYHDRIYVSARSIDEVNVQLIMEKLGGGGHMSTAGAQLPYTDMDKALATLKETIDQYEKDRS